MEPNFLGLKRELENFKKELGMLGGEIKLLFLEKPKFGHILANLSRWWEIKLILDPGWQPDLKIKEYLQKRGVPFFLVIKDCLLHEISHWGGGKTKGCPRDLQNHFLILEGARRGLKNTNLAEGVANFLEDLIVNAVSRLYFPPYPGIVVYFYDQGKLQAGQKFSPGYEIFVKTNLSIWGDQLDWELLEEFFSNKKEISKKVNKILEILECKEGDLKFKVDKLLHSSWEKKAYFLAKILEKVAKKSRFKNKICRESFGPSQPSEVKEKEKSFSQQSVLQSFKEGKGLPTYLDQFFILDALYQGLAQEIKIEVEKKKEDLSYPLIRFGRKEFDPKKHQINQIDEKSLVFDPEKGILKNYNFEIKRHRLSQNLPLEPGGKKFPDLCFIIDCSGSMSEQKEPYPWIKREGLKIKFKELWGKVTRGYGKALHFKEYRGDLPLPWGYQSKYHFALIGFYGCLKWLKAQGIAPYLKWLIIRFATNSHSSGWKEYWQIEDLKRFLFVMPEGATQLSKQLLQKELGEKDPTLIIMLSDGSLQGWPRLKKTFREIISRHYFSLIKIGLDKNEFTEDLEKWGYPITRVRKKEDLSQIIIDVTKQEIQKILEI